MKRFLTLILVVTMIFSCAGGMASAAEWENREVRPESITSTGRLMFISPDYVRKITYEDGKAIFSWGSLKHFVYDLEWDENGTKTYLIADREEKRDSSNRLINSSHIPCTILTKDNVKDIRIFDGDTPVPNDGIVTIDEKGVATIAREYIDKGYSMYIEANCCDEIHWDKLNLVVSTSYGKGKVSHIPNCWYLDYDDIPTKTEDGAKLIYCLVPQISYPEAPKYVDAFAANGAPRLSLIGEPKSSNGYWVYTVKIPSNYTSKIDFCFDFGKSATNHARLGIYINPGTADSSEHAAEPEVFNVQEALDYAKITTKTSKVSKGTKVTAKVLAIDEEAFAEAGYTLKLKYYRSAKKSSGYKLMATRDLGKTYTNSKGTAGKKYYYKVRLAAFDANGELVAQTALKQSTAGARTFKK